MSNVYARADSFDIDAYSNHPLRVQALPDSDKAPFFSAAYLSNSKQIEGKSILERAMKRTGD